MPLRKRDILRLEGGGPKKIVLRREYNRQVRVRRLLGGDQEAKRIIREAVLAYLDEHGSEETPEYFCEMNESDIVPYMEDSAVKTQFEQGRDIYIGDFVECDAILEEWRNQGNEEEEEEEQEEEEEEEEEDEEDDEEEQPCAVFAKTNRCRKSEVSDGNCYYNKPTKRCRKK